MLIIEALVTRIVVAYMCDVVWTTSHDSTGPFLWINKRVDRRWMDGVTWGMGRHRFGGLSITKTGHYI